jgi:hypothetical protein
MSLIRRIKNSRRLTPEFDWRRKPPDPTAAKDGPGIRPGPRPVPIVSPHPRRPPWPGGFSCP